MRRVDLYIARLRTLQTSKDNDQIKRQRPPTGPLDAKDGLVSKDREARDRERERDSLWKCIPAMCRRCKRSAFGPRDQLLVLGRFGLTDQSLLALLKDCAAVLSYRV